MPRLSWLALRGLSGRAGCARTWGLVGSGALGLCRPGLRSGTGGLLLLATLGAAGSGTLLVLFVHVVGVVSATAQDGKQANGQQARGEGGGGRCRGFGGQGAKADGGFRRLRGLR